MSWEKYLALRPQVIEIEDSIAAEWVSPELMEALRLRPLDGPDAAGRVLAVRQIRSQVLRVLRGLPLDVQRLADLVNLIRNNISSFPEWAASDTAKLFAPPVFRNQRRSSGYFF